MVGGLSCCEGEGCDQGEFFGNELGVVEEREFDGAMVQEGFFGEEFGSVRKNEGVGCDLRRWS